MCLQETKKTFVLQFELSIYDYKLQKDNTGNPKLEKAQNKKWYLTQKKRIKRVRDNTRKYKNKYMNNNNQIKIII